MNSVQEQVRTMVALLLKRPITEAIVIQVKSIEGYKHLEITDGEWVGIDQNVDEMTTGEEHGWIEFLLLLLLGNHVVANDLGRVYPGDVTFVLNGDAADIRIMREPDVAFVAKANVVSTKGFIYRAPDLAIEIVSPSQDRDETVAKAAAYFRYGTQQVWIVLPDAKAIEAHLPDETFIVYQMGDTLPGGELLPGFTLEVAAVFKH